MFSWNAHLDKNQPQSSSGFISAREMIRADFRPFSFPYLQSSKPPQKERTLQSHVRESMKDCNCNHWRVFGPCPQLLASPPATDKNEASIWQCYHLTLKSTNCNSHKGRDYLSLSHWTGRKQCNIFWAKQTYHVAFPQHTGWKSAELYLAEVCRHKG